MTREERRDAGRYIKKHGLERKEDSKKFVSRVGERIRKRYQEAQDRRAFKKSPAGQREEVSRLELEARKERAKTSIHKAKHSRRSQMFGGGQSSTQPRRRSGGRRRVQQNVSSFDGFGSGSGDGLGDMFGGTGQQSTHRISKKKSNDFAGMDSLF